MGFEPTTSAVTGRRSNQLSHQAKNSFYSEGHTLKTEYRSSYLPSTSSNPALLVKLSAY